ncbi:hypothetical protein [Pantoea wallisii]|nr:hypothetical protein [Pantoea wallisii]
MMEQLLCILNASYIKPSNVGDWTFIDFAGIFVGALLGTFFIQTNKRKIWFYLLSIFSGIFGAAPTSEIISNLLPLERDLHPAIGAVICSGFFISVVEAWKKKIKKQGKLK